MVWNQISLIVFLGCGGKNLSPFSFACLSLTISTITRGRGYGRILVKFQFGGWLILVILQPSWIRSWRSISLHIPFMSVSIFHHLLRYFFSFNEISSLLKISITPDRAFILFSPWKENKNTFFNSILHRKNRTSITPVHAFILFSPWKDNKNTFFNSFLPRKKRTFIVISLRHQQLS